MNTSSLSSPIWRRIRSFTRRDSRITKAQFQAYEQLGPTWQLQAEAGELDFYQTFGRLAPCFIEIGFGSGHSLAALAKQQPDRDFIGIEMFKPGIGALLQQIEVLALYNIRIYYGDAVEILEKCIPDHSLQGIQIFFPDPWPKRRHHKRRLIQETFVALAARKLKKAGLLHLTTDWQDYAKEMMKVLSKEKALHNVAGQGQFAERSALRPLITKFEGRGEKEGRLIWELQFAKE
ncbi:MAG TPA: tRNA (guanosine(46)-N7)-methyltransferase TrmB [Gammaproteobacteria bacterium]|nr:tRNA (guanosine(46)-N7)-methyltransferase TrmB [Gammaproteobacteria bacterium]